LAELTGFARIAPALLWNDFRLFLHEVGVEQGPPWYPVDAMGESECCQFFPDRNCAEVQQVIVAYFAERASS
jgi:hypothetical protein